MQHFIRILVQAYDVAMIIDARGQRGARTRKCDCGEGPRAVKKSEVPTQVAIVPNDIAGIIYVLCNGVERARDINGGKNAYKVHETLVRSEERRVRERVCSW